MFKLRLPIFAKISSFVTVISLVIIIVLSYYAINVNQLTLSLTIKDYYISIIDQISSKLVNQFERIPEDLIKYVSILNNDNIATAEKINLISLEIIHSEAIDYTMVYDNDGALIDIFYPKNHELPFDDLPKLSAEAIESLSINHFFQGIPRQFNGTGNYYAQIVIPWEKQGELLGYIGTFYDISSLEELIKNTSLKRFGTDNNIYIYNNLSEPVMASNPDRIKYLFVQDYALKRLFESNTKPLAITRDYTIDSEKMITSLQILPAYNLMIGVEQPYDIAYQSITNLKKVIFVIALITLLFTQFISLLFTRILTNPIEKLSELIASITKKKEFGETVEVKGNDEISDLAYSFNHLSQDLKNFSNIVQKDAVIKGNLARFLAPQVVSRITDAGEDVGLPDEEREIAVIFADLHGFTAMSELMTATTIIELLNSYFSNCVDIIYSHNGTVDKFIGDCIMAMYNAPYDVERPALMAVESAIKITDFMQNFTGIFSDELTSLGLKKISVGIGIAYGKAIVGNIGSKNRIDYTVVGDTVNIASHLQVLAHGNNEILIDKNCYEAVKDQIECEFFQKVNLKTKTNKSDVYRVIQHYI